MSSSSASNNNNNIMDGKATAQTIRNELKHQIAQLSTTFNTTTTTTTTPGLAVILVGSRRDSQTYVRMKKKACDQVGIASFGYDFDDTVTQDTLLSTIQSLNANPAVHGILIQLPLPTHLNEQVVLEAVDPAKDVDGLHPHNVARLCATHTHGASCVTASSVTASSVATTHTGTSTNAYANLNDISFPIACTPQGCIELLDRYDVPIHGQRAVVIGRSNLVGLPVALLLMHRHATVTIVHSQTPRPWEVVKEADIVIAAVGKANLVKADWLKEGVSVVVDVGINSVDDASSKKGYRLVGDVDFEEAQHVARLITPVPGGVGPMTIAMLLRNTVKAWRMQSVLSGESEV